MSEVRTDPFQVPTYAYNGDSTRRNIVRGDGVRTDYTYETPVTGRIRNLNHYVPAAGTQPARTISSRTYGYDALDRMRWFQKSASTATNPLENGRGESYGYDPAGQLVSAAYEVANPAGANVPNDALAYDAMGNRTTVNGTAYPLNTAGLNQYGTAGSYGTASYDGRGNLKTLGAFSASYDAQNEMTSGTVSGNSVSLSYDAVGRCVKRVVNTVVSYFYYDGWSLIEEDNSAGAAQRLYVHGPATDELAALWNASSNSWAWYHYDARGSVTHLTNASGQLIEQYSYSAFGVPKILSATGSQLTTSAFNNRFLFQGRDWIKELSVYEYRNRMYHPGIGRFLQPDPLSLDAGDQNIYRYCNNDPINGSDPLGLDPSMTGAFFYGVPGYSNAITAPPSTYSFTFSSYSGAGTPGYGLQSLFSLLSPRGGWGTGNVTMAQQTQAPESFNPNQLQHGNDPWAMTHKSASDAFTAGERDKREYHSFTFENLLNSKDFVRTPLRISGRTGTINETEIGSVDKKSGQFFPFADVKGYKFWGVGMNEVRYNKIMINTDLELLRKTGVNAVIMTPPPPSGSLARQPPYYYNAQKHLLYGP